MTRINIGQTNKAGYSAVFGLESHISRSVDPDLLHLIKLRASILNGCGYCVDMHATSATKEGIPTRKLHAVAAWEHATVLFDEREQAVLALTDAITKLGPDTVTDEIWDRAAKHFDDTGLGDVVLAIATINVWNRIAISTRIQPPVDAMNPIA
ncbi:carboxymuconolactone decarboxylase family protein [Pseudarthrobacter sp. J75]|uniref:carboxymuconolactone decarboxylase family protein n=1 Tax=unclassified Pseudarthrobacter TaxID=2647000 RepID=UPI002E823F3B|nr:MULTISPECIES: carboxymuconolactone decarboxylase family protein [unclassified Pseudarthrobacter]MEE2523467.1 carboxymuconolactone decarboxylase family protein [Pseudarthrobacter sp. J47]MEE2530442.1 carboxymuconolactone decarboxylase family protein [Pseudarthrobacter sp. J75]MEE2570154.1 carboxymuconolactone decarboxylase family protein [Pseudarthrobacter sp. J64]